MSRRTLIIGIGACALALLALLAYSLERTAWLFSLFEQRYELAIAAAVVVELAAVALLIGGATLATIDATAQAWANRALAAVLSVQALANLSAGFLRGGARTLGAFEGDGWRWYAGYAVASALWLTTNLAVPVLILCLSKLLERLVGAWGAQASRTDAHPHKSDAPLPLFACRKCGAPMDTQPQAAASARWGCAACKAARKAA